MNKKIILISLASIALIGIGAHLIGRSRKMKIGSKEANDALSGMKMY